jgi:hypothetical protein
MLRRKKIFESWNGSCREKIRGPQQAIASHPPLDPGKKRCPLHNAVLCIKLGSPTEAALLSSASNCTFWQLGDIDITIYN